jgi:archaellum component FlaC
MNKEKLVTEEYFKENTKDFVTKSYLDETLDKRFDSFEKKLDKKLSNYVTKDYLKEENKKMLAEIKHYNKDLQTGFLQSIYGMGDHIKGIEEKVNKLDKRVTALEQLA